MRVPIFFQVDIVKSESGKDKLVLPPSVPTFHKSLELSFPDQSISTTRTIRKCKMVSNRYSRNNFSAEKIQERDPQLLVPGIVHDISPEQQPILLRTPPRLSINSKAKTMRVRELKADKMVEAWDKIGVLTSDVTKAIMKKQADTIAKRYRQEGSHHDDDANIEESRSKKQRLEDRRQQSDDVVVNLPEENWSASLTRCIDRMARMSKLIMEIEYCHRLLREEMVEIQNDLAS